MCIGRRVKEIRELKGLSQKELAQLLRISGPSLASLEEDDNPRYQSIERFCETLNITISFLVSEDLPITEENLEFFANNENHSFLLTHERMRQKAEVFEEMIGSNPDALQIRRQFLG